MGKKTQKTDVPKSGYIIGTDKSITMMNKKKADHHDGMILGGSITSGRKSPEQSSINMLPSGRSDGRIL